MGTGIIKWLKRQKRRLLRKPHVLYFCHIPKTAGTTFDRMIRSRFARDLDAPITSNLAYFTNPDLNLDQYDLISGHLLFGHHIPDMVTRPVRSVVLLREPRALLLSMFKHGSQYEKDPVHGYIQANCPTPEQFFKDPLMGPYVANPMARFLGQSERALTPEIIASACGQPPEKASEIVCAAQAAPGHDSQVLEKALERLAQFHVVGLSENLRGSANLVARMEEWPLFGEVPHHNKSASKLRVKDLSAETIRTIDSLTELDREVYRQGQRIFHQLMARERFEDELPLRLHQAQETSVRKAA